MWPCSDVSASYLRVLVIAEYHRWVEDPSAMFGERVVKPGPSLIWRLFVRPHTQVRGRVWHVHVQIRYTTCLRWAVDWFWVLVLRLSVLWALLIRPHTQVRSSHHFGT